MKQTLLIFAIFAFNQVVVAQSGTVGIGTNMPDSTASLDLGAPDKGFLPNKVALNSIIDTAPISKDGVTVTPAIEMPDGLLVYNTATAGTAPDNVVPGYYAWNSVSSSWKALSPPPVQVSSTYTHWGRNDCPGADLVYSGYAAGTQFNHTGSGANTLCITDAPVYQDIIPGAQNLSLIYGTEYETAFPSGTDHSQATGVCAVCEVEYANTIMIPATNTCPVGWTEQYSGYVMSTTYQQEKSNYVCVDDNPSAPTSLANENGNLWYTTETRSNTGSLPSSIYVDGGELTCVVCSK
jgi:hypothetical protein